MANLAELLPDQGAEAMIEQIFEKLSHGLARIPHQSHLFSLDGGVFKPQRGALSQPRPTAWVSGMRLYAKP
jgi:pentose-5-phosphate-3-epimerase